MGAIADAINGFDKAEAEKADISSQLDVLTELAKTKADLAKERIERELLTAGSEMSKTIPISTVREKTYESHAYAQSSAGSISDTIGKSVKAFIKGGSQNILDGVCSLMEEGISAFLGAGSGSEDIYEKMFIVNEGQLSLLRFDVWGWKRQAMGKGIKTKVECVSAFVGVKSVINFEKLDFPTFINLYQQQLENSRLANSDMIGALKQAREIYNVMTGKDAVPLDSVERRRPLLMFNRGFSPRLR